jgi:chromosome segregation ATPase
LEEEKESWEEEKDSLEEEKDSLEEETASLHELNEALHRKVAVLEIDNKPLAQQADQCTGECKTDPKFLGNEVKWLKHNNARLHDELALLQDKYDKVKAENSAKGEVLKKMYELSSSNGVLDPASPSLRALSVSEYNEPDDDMDDDINTTPVGSVLASGFEAWSELSYARDA